MIDLSTDHGSFQELPLGRQLIADARFYQRLASRRDGTTPSLARTVLRNRGLWLLTFHRIAYSCMRHRDTRRRPWWSARVLKSVVRGFSVVLCRSSFMDDCEIKGAAYLPNGGYLICGARSIGAGSLIHDRCTFGYALARRREGRPLIGSNVWIGPDCIIGGAVTVGDGATILRGSFLTCSVPPSAVVKGNPAVIVRHMARYVRLAFDIRLELSSAQTYPTGHSAQDDPRRVAHVTTTTAAFCASRRRRRLRSLVRAASEDVQPRIAHASGCSRSVARPGRIQPSSSPRYRSTICLASKFVRT